jgi:penicillin-binding protein 1A
MKKFSPIHLLIVLIVITAFSSFGIYLYFQKVISTGMPSLSILEDPDQELSTQILSADGKLIGTFYSEQKRIKVPYDSIPDHFVKALVASEDRKFYDHWGPDPDRIIKAIVKRVFFGQRSGASTITQQVARNLFLNQDRKLERKIREAATAVKIEQIYTKEQIIEMYANTVLFGKGAFGLGAAAKTYFNKDPQDLTLSESAMLVGILPRPSGYNPFHDYDKAKLRRNLVLNAMVDTKAISKSEASEAKTEEFVLNYGDKEKKTASQKLGDNIAPHFLEMLRQEFSTPEMLGRFNIYRDGMLIKTTLNTKIQKYALEAVEQHITEMQEKFDKRYRWRPKDSLIAGVITKSIITNNKYRQAKTKAEKRKVAQQLRANKSFMDSVRNVATTVQCGLVVIDAKTGAILAMVGASPKSMHDNIAADYSLNHVTQIKRQPGSSMKPFVYAASLSNGYRPDYMIECGPFSYMLFDSTYWEPKGTGSCEEGDTRTLESALQWSINTVSARLITRATNPEEVIHLCRKAGIKSQLDPYPALSLGAGGGYQTA